MRRGETLALIARRAHVPMERIAAANRLPDLDRIIVGQRLVLPDPPAATVVLTPGDTVSAIARTHHTSVTVLRALNPDVADPDRVLAGSGLRVPTPGSGGR